MHAVSSSSEEASRAVREGRWRLAFAQTSAFPILAVGLVGLVIIVVTAVTWGGRQRWVGARPLHLGERRGSGQLQARGPALLAAVRGTGVAGGTRG